MLILQNEARQQNHKEVVEEDKRNKLPSNWESRKRQAEWIIQDEAARKAAEEKVIYYNLYKYCMLQNMLIKFIYIYIYIFYREKIMREQNYFTLMQQKQNVQQERKKIKRIQIQVFQIMNKQLFVNIIGW